MKVKKKNRKILQTDQRGGGILEFAYRYRNYMLVLLGMILIYVESTYVNNYLIQYCGKLGGDIKRMGTLLTVSAMSELPTMLLFSRLVGKWDSRKTDSVCGGNVFCESTGVSGVWQYIVPVCSADAADVIICIMSAFCGILCK